MPSTTTKGQRPLTFDHLKSKKKPYTSSVWIAIDPSYVDAVNEARAKQERAQTVLTARPQDAGALAEFDQALEDVKHTTAELEKNAAKFVFRSIGRKKYDDLLGKHAPSEENKKEVIKSGGDPATLAFNPDTFPVALIAAAIVDPVLTVEQVQEMFDSDDWSGSEFTALFLAALEANTQRKVVELGNA